MGQGEIAAYSGEMHQLIGRLASEGDISSVVYSDDPSMDNAVGAFSKFASTVDIGGDAWNVWVSQPAVDAPERRDPDGELTHAATSQRLPGVPL